MEGKKEAEAQQISNILWNKAHKKQWQGIHRVTKRDKAGAVVRVEIMMPNATVQVCEGKEECKRAILDKISVRLDRAQSASVLLEESVEGHKVFDKLKQITAKKDLCSVKNLTDKEVDDALKKLDQLLTKIMLEAENK